jgi:hypothetical protein
MFTDLVGRRHGGVEQVRKEALPGSRRPCEEDALHVPE